MKKTLWAVLLAGLLPALALTAAPFISRTGTGLYNDKHGSASGSPVDTITANQAQTLIFKIKDPSGYDSLELIKIVVWNTNFATLATNNSDQYKAEYIFYPKTGVWAQLPGSPSWDLQETFCSAPATTNTSTNLMRFALVFEAGDKAQVDTAVKSWRITVSASNLGGGVTSSSTNLFLKFIADYTGLAGSSLLGVRSPFIISEYKTMDFFYQANDNADITLIIYTIYGEPVKTLIDNMAVVNGQTVTIDWDGKNGVGRTVASGIYSAILTSQGDGGKQTLVFNFAVYK